MKERHDSFAIQIEHLILILLAVFCMASVGSQVIFVLYHGMKTGLWGTKYFVDLFAAFVVCLLVRNMKPKVFCKDVAIRSAYQKLAFYAVLVFSFLIQYSVISVLKVTPDGDYAVFQTVASDIAKKNPILLSEYVALFPHILGYSTFLGVFFRLFGRNDIAPVINVFLGTLSTVLIYRVAFRRNGIYSALTAAALWTFCPSMLIYNTMVLSEPLYTAGILLFLFLLSRLDDGLERIIDYNELPAGSLSHRYLLTAAAGVLSGLLLQGIQAARPISGIILIALLLCLLLYRKIFFFNRLSARCSMIFFTCLLVVFFCAAHMWAEYSTEVLGEPPATFPGYNLLTGFNPETSGTHSTSDYQVLKEARAASGATAVTAQKAMLDHLFQRLHAGPQFLPRLFAEKLKTYSGSDDFAVYYAASALSDKGVAILEHCCNIYYYALFIETIGFCIRSCRERSQIRLCFLCALYVLGLSSAHIFLVEVNARYHYSILPILILILSEGFRIRENNTQA